MGQNEQPQSGTDALLKKLHERPQLPLTDWMRAPAHVHYKAFRMADPPTQRPASRLEFQSLLGLLKIPAETTVLRETFGYGIREGESGDRLIVVWQAHTEYYNYQLTGKERCHVWPVNLSDVPVSSNLIGNRGLPLGYSVVG